MRPADAAGDVAAAAADAEAAAAAVAGDCATSDDRTETLPTTIPSRTTGRYHTIQCQRKQEMKLITLHV